MISSLLATLPMIAALTMANPGLASREIAAESIVAPAELDTTVWAMARAAYVKARQRGVAQREFLVVIDYSKPSAEKRMWVVNMHNGELLTQTHVAHGIGSGYDSQLRFSNRVNSNQSSLGVFVTAESYWGKHGRALRLDGLEPGVNDKARIRNVVFHGSNYVSDEVAEQAGRVGRSQGCPAVDVDEAKRLVPILEGGSVIFAYYPEAKWLQKTRWIPEALRKLLIPAAQQDRRVVQQAPKNRTRRSNG